MMGRPLYKYANKIRPSDRHIRTYTRHIDGVPKTKFSYSGGGGGSCKLNKISKSVFSPPKYFVKYAYEKVKSARVEEEDRIRDEENKEAKIERKGGMRNMKGELRKEGKMGEENESKGQ
jgi:hypothetical protein